MSKFLLKIYLLVIVLCTIALTSCDNDPHDPDIELTGNVSKYFPSYCVNLSTSYSTNYNSFRLTCTPNFLFNTSEWNINIDKIDYYIDDVYCKTESIAPYIFTYESKNWFAGVHNVRADITISGKTIDTFILQCTKVVDNSTSQDKAADIWFDYDYSTTGQEFFISGNINYKRSSNGIVAKSFTASWDDVKIGECTSAPYKLTRNISEAAGSSHSVSATLKYSIGSSESSLSFLMASYQIPGSTSVMQTFRRKSRYQDYKNGEYLEGIARQFIGSEIKSTYDFELYLDNNLIAHSKSFPYEVSYLLNNLEVGVHTLKKQWVRIDEYGNETNSFSTDESITITK